MTNEGWGGKCSKLKRGAKLIRFSE